MEHGVINERGRLAALSASLNAHQISNELTTEGLRVRGPHREDLIDCRPRESDAGVSWFFTSQGEPLAPAEAVVDAVVRIKGHLTSPAETERLARERQISEFYVYEVTRPDGTQFWRGVHEEDPRLVVEQPAWSRFVNDCIAARCTRALKASRDR